MTDSEPEKRSGEEVFVVEITRHQVALAAFLCSLLGNRSAGDEVLQETNIVLWKKREEFEAGTSFRAWAFRVARFQAMAFLKREKRRGELVFGEEVIEKLAGEAEVIFEGQEERVSALRTCLGNLTEGDRDLVRGHYFEGLSMREQAKRVGRSVGALRQVLFRIRGALRVCIARRLAEEGAGA